LSKYEGQKNVLEMFPVLRIGMPRPPKQENSNNMQQLQGTVIIKTNFVHISVLNCFSSTKNVGILFLD
jgi:hypothetical protein